MVLLSVEEEYRTLIYPKLVYINWSLQHRDTFLEPFLVEGFTNNHQIDFVLEDKQKKKAIFVTQSFHDNDNNYSGNSSIDSVTVLKLTMNRFLNLS